MKQYEAVVQALRQNGGYATLGQLYKTTLTIPGCKWGTKTPFATIRRIVQTYPQLFFKIKPGLWGLTEHQETILQLLNLAEGSPAEGAEEFGHSYYQGLVVEIGNFRGYQTYVPSQDRDKKFLRKTLGDVSTSLELPAFTYEHLVKRASMIDVVWLNKRQFPGYFFEIEHTINIFHSLLRFLEFQDFRVKPYIVADANRKGEFSNKLNYSAFYPIRDAVKFIDYESLAEYHAKLLAMIPLKQQLDL